MDGTRSRLSSDSRYSCVQGRFEDRPPYTPVVEEGHEGKVARVVSEESDEKKIAAELLADWRAAGRDVVAARAGARVAELALIAAAEAETQPRKSS